MAFMSNISIVGLGYVGLPLMCRCAEVGHIVVGIDNDKRKIELIKKGISPIKAKDVEKKLRLLKDKVKVTDDIKETKNSDIIIVCVPTPVNEDHTPNLGYIKSSAEAISHELKKNQLIIIESTIYPGTSEEVVLPILEKSGLKTGKDFYLAHCPERIDPGNKRWTIENLPRVVGALSQDGLKKTIDFYKTITTGEVIGLSSIKAAEATKIMENTFRDVNIAFVNEMAKSFDKAGIDIIEVIRGASNKPFGFLPHYPGCGVGGHCIPVDPYYLIEKAKQIGFDHNFLSLAREINNSMPIYTVNLLENELKKINKNIENSNIGILGLAYKKDIDDLRESPTLRIIEILKNKKANVKVFDPYIKEKSNVNNMGDLLKKSDYIILATDHTKFKNMDINKLKENNIKIIIDGRNCLDKNKIKDLGIIYKGVGR